MKKTFFAATILLCCILLTACNVPTGQGFAFGAPYNLSLVNYPDSALQTLENELARLDTQLSADNTAGDIARINAATANTAVLVAEDTIYLIKLAFEFGEKYREFNIAMRPLVELWGFDEGFSVATDTTPNYTEIAETLALCSPDNFVVDEDNSTVTKLIDGAKLDLGAIGKGYAARRMRELDLAEKGNGIAAVLDIGGTVAAIGDITVGIKDPRGAGSAARFHLVDSVVSTSGDYERFFTVEGVRYAHIIGADGYPANTHSDVISVTVICEDGAMADILSTYIFIVGYQKGAIAAAEYGASFILFTESAYSVYGDIDFEILAKRYKE